MFRKHLIKLLLENPMSLRQIARMEEELPDRIADDLNHLFRSLKHTEYEAVIEPARCRACGFEYSGGKLNKPSKRSNCHGTWVLEPKIGIGRRT